MDNKYKKIIVVIICLIVCLFNNNVYADSNSNSNTASNTTSNTTSNSNTTSTKTSNKKPNADFMVVDNYVSCGGTGSSALVKNIPSILPRITSSVYNTIMVIVPVALILLGIVDLIKGIMSQKEDEIKKGRDSLIKRLVTGIIIFLIVMLVKLFVNIINGGNDSSRIIGCIDCFVSNECDKMSTGS